MVTIRNELRQNEQGEPEVWANLGDILDWPARRPRTPTIPPQPVPHWRSSRCCSISSATQPWCRASSGTTSEFRRSSQCGVPEVACRFLAVVMICLPACFSSGASVSPDGVETLGQLARAGAIRLPSFWRRARSAVRPRSSLRTAISAARPGAASASNHAPSSKPGDKAWSRRTRSRADLPLFALTGIGGPTCCPWRGCG